MLALAGSLALCVTAGADHRLTAPRNWLRWLGEHSIVVYLVFVLPMSFARIALGKLGLIQDVTLSSFLVMVVSIVASVGLYLLVAVDRPRQVPVRAARPGPTSPAPRAAAVVPSARRPAE